MLLKEKLSVASKTRSTIAFLLLICVTLSNLLVVSAADVVTSNGDNTLFLKDITENGIISCSDKNSPEGEEIENVFDNSTSTKWLIFKSSGWVKYKFAGNNAYAVKSYSISSANDYPERDPKEWKLLGSNDGNKWIQLDSQTNQNFSERFQTKIYNIKNNNAYKYYKLSFKNHEGDILQISEIQLFNTSADNMTSMNGSNTLFLKDITENGVISCSDKNSPKGEEVEKVFDNSTNTKWLIFNSSGWVKYKFANDNAYNIKAYSISSANDYPERDPKEWKLLGSNDGKSWMQLDSQTNQNFSERFQTKIYNIKNSKAYKYYKLSFKNHEGGILQISEIQLFQTKTVSGNLNNDWSDFNPPTVLFQDEAQSLEGSAIFKKAIPDVKKLIEDRCLEVCKKLYKNNTESRKEPLKITVVLADKPNSVSWKSNTSSGAKIGISAQYVAKLYSNNKNDYSKVAEAITGILTHECTHCYQYSPKNCGGYTKGTEYYSFIEGMADYVRASTVGWLGNPAPAKPKKGGNWIDGYTTTGLFIDWIVKNKNSAFAIELNRTAQTYDTWSWDRACKDIIGQDVKTLWNEYQSSIS